MPKLSFSLKNIALCIFILFMLKPVFSSLKHSLIDFTGSKTKVGIVSISGPIMNSSCSIKVLHTLFKDPTIKAIVIQMDSPGGAAGSSQAVYEEIKYYKKQYPKPVITYVENICASGGYYIATATDHIIATPSAFIGIFSGRQAVALKLIDELGSLSAVEAAVKKHAAISNEILWIKQPKNTGLFSSLFGCQEDDLDVYESSSFLDICITRIMSYIEQKTSFGIRT